MEYRYTDSTGSSRPLRWEEGEKGVVQMRGAFDGQTGKTGDPSACEEARRGKNRGIISQVQPLPSVSDYSHYLNLCLSPPPPSPPFPPFLSLPPPGLTAAIHSGLQQHCDRAVVENKTWAGVNTPSAPSVGLLIHERPYRRLCSVCTNQILSISFYIKLMFFF